MGLNSIQTTNVPNGNGGERKAKRRNKSSIKSGFGQRITKSGRWTDSERQIFLKGLKRFGRGKWKEIATLIPTRSTVQVKTHAQMVMKRVEAGEDVFAEFQESLVLPINNNKYPQQASVVLHAVTAVPIPYSSSMETLQMFDSLSPSDRGAVLILCEMARLRAFRVL